MWKSARPSSRRSATAASMRAASSDDKGPMLIPIEVVAGLPRQAGQRCRSTSSSCSRARRRSAARTSSRSSPRHAELLAADFVHLGRRRACGASTSRRVTVASRGLAGAGGHGHRARQGPALRPPRRRGGQPAPRARRAARRPARRQTAASRSPASTTASSQLHAGASARRSPRSRSTRRAYLARGRRAARAWASRATAPWSASGRGRRWSSTACGAATRGRAARPSSPSRGARQDHLPAGAGPGPGRHHREDHPPPGDASAAGRAAGGQPRSRTPHSPIASPPITSACAMAEAVLAQTFGVQPLWCAWAAPCRSARCSSA